MFLQMLSFKHMNRFFYVTQSQMQQLRGLCKNINICRAGILFSQNQIPFKAFWRMLGAMDPFAAFLRCDVINIHRSNIIWCSSYKKDWNFNSEVLNEKITPSATLYFCFFDGKQLIVFIYILIWWGRPSLKGEFSVFVFFAIWMY